jgi:predicted hotdog family 3-hydroxylacyl-ACP dehydratase
MTPREIETEIELPANCCAGHFPDRPLVPGVLQLLLVERAVAEATGEDLSLSEVSRVRWRKPVTPVDRLRLSAAVGESRVRFDLSVDGTTACDGSFAVGRLPLVEAAHAPEPTAGGGPDPSTLLPHRPPMLFIERVVEWGEHGGVCRGRIDPDACLAAGDDAIPAAAAIEFAAQAVGAVEMCRSGHHGPPRSGVLVAVSRTVLTAGRFPVTTELTAQVGPTTWSPPMARSSARVIAGGREILSCHLTTWESNP